jgi:hypothetical protein
MSQAKKNYSDRSRSSIIEEIQVRAGIAKTEGLKKEAERQVARMEGEVKRLRGIDIATGDSLVHANLIEAQKELNAQRDLAKGYDEAIGEMEAAIGRLSPSLAEMHARTEQQAKMESLVMKRLETERKIDAAVEGLRGLLAEHRRETEEMRAVGAALGAPLPAANFDAAALLSALPEGVAEAAEKWAGHFLGEPKGGKIHVVRAEYLSVPETLAHHGCYQFGEEIRLDPEEAAELLANDYAAPVRSAPWRRLPARVMTVEQFQRANAQAEQRKVSVAQIIFEQDVAQDIRDRAYYAVNKVSPVGRRRELPKDREIAFGTAQKVSGRALGNIDGPRVGESYRAGEVIEGLSLPQAWQLVDAGSLAAL